MQDLSSFWVAIISGPLGAFLSWVFTRNKTKAESAESIASGASQAVEAISSVLESLRAELDATKNELEAVTKQLHDLRIQNEELMKENKKLFVKLEEFKKVVQNSGLDKKFPDIIL